jgi:hypothetical protein
MPHQVVKCTAEGSQGDLARIAEALREIDVNIVALGGAEGFLSADKEVGVVAMLLSPDDETADMPRIIGKLQGLVLDQGNHISHVENFPDIQVELDDKVGELEKAVKAVDGINILSVISIDKHAGATHVSFGFGKGDHKRAQDALDKAKIKTVPPHSH